MKKNFPGLLAPHQARRDHGWARLHVRGRSEGAHGPGLERLPQRDEARWRRQGRRRGLLSAQGADGQRGVHGGDLGHLVGSETTLLSMIWLLRPLWLFGGRQALIGNLPRFPSTCVRCFVCFVLDPVSVHGSKTKCTKHLTQVDGNPGRRL